MPNDRIVRFLRGEGSSPCLIMNGTLEAITNEVGYASYSHFFQVFRRHFGMGPKEWREEHFGAHEGKARDSGLPFPSNTSKFSRFPKFQFALFARFPEFHGTESSRFQRERCSWRIAVWSLCQITYSTNSAIPMQNGTEPHRDPLNQETSIHLPIQTLRENCLPPSWGHSWLLGRQRFKQLRAAKHHIAVGRIEIAGVPGIRYIAG
jgi:hypothetical protein